MMNDSAFVLQWEAAPRETLTRILVLEHFSSILHVVQFLHNDQDNAYAAAIEVFSSAVSASSEKPFTGEVTPRLWLLALAAEHYFSQPASDSSSPKPHPKDDRTGPNLDAIAALDQRARLAVFLRYAEQLPVKDISRILGRREEPVEKQLNQAETALRENHVEANLQEYEKLGPAPDLHKTIQAWLEGGWPFPGISPEEMDKAIAAILRKTARSPSPNRQARRSAENIRTTLLIAAIILAILLFNPERAVRTARIWFATPTIIPPTPVLSGASLKPAAPSLDPQAAPLRSMRILENFPFPITAVDFSENGDLFAAGPAKFGVYDCRVEGNLNFYLLDDFNPSLDKVAVSPSNGLLATGTFNGVVIVWDSKIEGPGKRLFVLSRHPGPIIDLAFSPNGKYLAAGTRSGTWIWELSDSARRTAVLPGELVGGIAFSPDEGWLATYEADQTIWLRSLPEGQVALRLGGLFDVSKIAFSADGHLLAAGVKNRVQVWELSLRPDQPARAQLVHVLAVDGGVPDLAFSPRAAELAIITGADELLLWDASAPKALQPALQAAGTQMSRVGFSPDGSRIAVGTRGGAMYLLEQPTADGPESGKGASFTALEVNQLTRDELAGMDTDCGRFQWQQALLNKQGLGYSVLDLEEGAEQLYLPGFPDPVRLLENDPTSLSKDIRRFVVYEDEVQIVLLVVHQPRQLNSRLRTKIEFQDTLVGQNSSIENIYVGGLNMQYLRGGWVFRITDEPLFEFSSVQTEEVDWQVRWEPSLPQQRVRWENDGMLLELIHFSKDEEWPPDRNLLLTQEDLIGLLRPLVSFPFPEQ